MRLLGFGLIVVGAVRPVFELVNHKVTYSDLMVTAVTTVVPMAVTTWVFAWASAKLLGAIDDWDLFMKAIASLAIAAFFAAVAWLVLVGRVDLSAIAIGIGTGLLFGRRYHRWW